MAILTVAEVHDELTQHTSAEASNKGRRKQLSLTRV